MSEQRADYDAIPARTEEEWELDAEWDDRLRQLREVVTERDELRARVRRYETALRNLVAGHGHIYSQRMRCKACIEAYALVDGVVLSGAHELTADEATGLAAALADHAQPPAEEKA